MEDVVERFSRAEIFLTFETIFWGQPKSMEHYQMPVVIKTGADAMALFRGLGFG